MRQLHYMYTTTTTDTADIPLIHWHTIILVCNQLRQLSLATPPWICAIGMQRSDS